jgi:dTDP-L-rhamnose 4-epimerase
MANILITGGAGFIATHTAKALLSEGHNVRLFDNLDPQIHGPERKWPSYSPQLCEKIIGSITHREQFLSALRDVDAIYHFASHTGVGQSMYEIENYYHTNVQGTALMAELIIKEKLAIKKLILASSRAVYGEGKRLCATHGPFYATQRNPELLASAQFIPLCPQCKTESYAYRVNEFKNLQPRSYYGLTKLAQEQICQTLQETLGTSVIVLRYFNVYGSYQSLINGYTGIVSGFFNKLIKDQKVSLYEKALPERNFVHVLDVVQANLLALKYQNQGTSVFNVGVSESHSLLSLANKFKTLLNSNSLIEITNLYRIGDIFSCAPDLNLAQKILGFEAHVGLIQGLQEFVIWAKDQDSEFKVRNA